MTLFTKNILYLTKDVSNDIQTNFQKYLGWFGFIYRTHKFFSFIERGQFFHNFLFFFCLLLYKLNVLCKYFLLPFVIVAIDIIENDKISWFSAPFKCKVWELVVCNNRTIHPLKFFGLPTNPPSLIYFYGHIFIFVFMYKSQ